MQTKKQLEIAAKKAAIQDIKEDLREEGKCFLMFHEELDPVMRYLVREYSC